MFRRMISMLLIGSLVIVGNDALASGRKATGRKATGGKFDRSNRLATRNAKKNAGITGITGITGKPRKVKENQIFTAVVAAIESGLIPLSPALKTAFTKAGVQNPAQRDLLMGIVRGVKARQGQQAAQPVFTDKDLIDLLQNPKTIKELHDGAVEAVKIIDIVIAKRTWKHFAPVADVLEAIRPQLAGFHGFIEAKIASGEWTLATPVDNSVHSQPAEQTGAVIHCPVTVIKKTAEIATQTHEPVLLRKKE